MFQSVCRFLACTLWLAGVASPAYAQDDPRLALLTSFPNPTISFQYEVNDRFAVRVETTYTYHDETSEQPTGGIGIGVGSSFDTTTRERLIESQTHTGSVGFAAIVTLHRADQFRLYLAPRVAATFSNQSATITERVTRTRTGGASPTGGNLMTVSTGEPEEVSDSSISPTVGASVGAAVNVHRRLALFGEAGVSYSRRERSALLPVSLTLLRDGSESEFTTVSSRAVGGLMFRF
jgi:hypothetical protein